MRPQQHLSEIYGVLPTASTGVYAAQRVFSAASERRTTLFND